MSEALVGSRYVVRVEGMRRKAVALAVLAMLGGLAALTMEAGRPRWLVLILLAGFALRVALTRSQTAGTSRYDRGDVGES